jgi:hypothetical protein
MTRQSCWWWTARAFVLTVFGVVGAPLSVPVAHAGWNTTRDTIKATTANIPLVAAFVVVR